MKLSDLYIRFIVWLGAEPPAGYKYLLAEKDTPKPLPALAKKLPPIPPRPPASPLKPRPAAPPLRGPSPVTYTGEAQKLYHNLLLKAMHDPEIVQRLIEHERQRSPGASEEEILQNAIDRWEHDNR
jgi:hypothetical protein